jgi:cytochrome c
MKLFLSGMALALASAIVPVLFAPVLAADPAAAPASADAEALLKKYACVACHSTAAKVVGPAYKDVAAKYRDNKDAEKILTEKVKKGGSGVWGAVPMPPNASVPDADLQAIVQWILALK